MGSKRRVDLIPRLSSNRLRSSKVHPEIFSDTVHNKHNLDGLRVSKSHGGLESIRVDGHAREDMSVRSARTPSLPRYTRHAADHKC